MIFSFLRPNPEKKLQKEYETIMKKALDAQRNGDMDSYATLSSKASKVLENLNKIKDKNS